MKLTKDQVEHVAKLANLPVTEEEIEKYSEQLSRILDYIDQLDSVNTSNIEPTFNVTGMCNSGAKDIPVQSLTQEETLSNAKVKKNGFFVTKGVFENE